MTGAHEGTDVSGLGLPPHFESAARDWWDETNDALRWLHRRWFPFSAIWLGLGAAYLFDFSLTRHVPLELGTPGIAGALPMMAVLSAATILGASIALMAPVMLLPMPCDRHSRSIIEFCSRDPRRTQDLSRCIMRSWIAASVFLAVLVGVFVLVAAICNSNRVSAIGVFASPAITALVWQWSFLPQRRRHENASAGTTAGPAIREQPTAPPEGTHEQPSQAPAGWRAVIAHRLPSTQAQFGTIRERFPASAGNLAMTALAFFVQALVLTATVLVVIAATSTDPGSLFSRVLLLVAVSALVVAMQSWLPFAIIRSVPSWVHPLRRLILLLTGVAAICAAIPPIGGALAAVPLTITASGGLGCAVLESAPGAVFRVPDGIHSAPPAERELAVHIVANIGGSYYVTRTTSSDAPASTALYPIARVTVAGIRACND